MQKQNKNYWGFDIKSIDQSVRPQDDFYTYANGGWLKKTNIPADESRWGSFTILRYNTEEQLRNLMQALTKKKSYKAGSDQQLVTDAYQAAADLHARNKLGIRPIEPLLERVRGITSLEELLAVVAGFHSRGIPSLWAAFVDQDNKDSSRYILTLWQSGLSLPERDYYLLQRPEQQRVRDAFLKHIKRLLTLARFSKQDITRTQKVVMKIETLLAKASMSKEDTREPEKTYHKMTVAQLSHTAPAVPWPLYFETTDARVRQVIVGQPKFFTALSKLLKHIPLEEWKVYMEWHLINGSASALSEPFIKANFEFYGRTLTGTKKLRAPWRRALGAATGLVGESLGKLYIQKYFPDSSKHTMDALVSDLFAVYKKRIQNLDWMSSATKKKALAKLKLMRRKIGYPSAWKGYRGLLVKRDDHFGNLLRAGQFEHTRAMKKLRGPVDRGEWFMYPQTVNAYFSPNLNEIVFPAAILQWPFFDPRADMAVNYGGIGSVIGHEITHGFDDQGSKFDGKGNLKSWWTPADRKRFDKKAQVLVKQTNGQEVEPGIYINGTLTLGENIADLGGLIIAYEAYQKYLAKHGRKNIEGLSPEERFFLGFAQMEREAARPEFKKLAALTDPHANATWRINGPLSNYEPFYKAFNLKKGDTLYRSPSTQVKIW
ncbi:M13 family peptidase [Candidatus Kaiserbacteria bacterium]|nr:M13 family peptidase [Candidatus Kaiserbacteria bacterium]